MKKEKTKESEKKKRDSRRKIRWCYAGKFAAVVYFEVLFQVLDTPSECLKK